MTKKESEHKIFLSFCSIVRDEQDNLPRCLSSVKAYVDEMIIVDTGSQDDTVKIALEYGAKVSNFQWCGDFAKAKNYAISQAAGEWILFLDADHELIIKEKNFRDQIRNNSGIIAYSIDWIDAHVPEDLSPVRTPLLFRNINQLRYKGRYHEDLTYEQHSISSEKLSYLNSIKVLHYGFSEEQLLKKALNRIKILENLIEEEGVNLMLLLTLSGMYQMTQNAEKIHECNTKVFDYLLPYLIAGKPPENFRAVASWLFDLGSQCLQNKDYETALLLCQHGLEWCPNYPPLTYLTGELLLDLGFPLGAIPYFKNCLEFGKNGNYNKSEPFDLKLTKIFPAYRLGCAYSQLKSWKEAKDYLELALYFDINYTPAKEKLQTLKEILIT
jgi:glycosyltransferase involved in cell wall biosynthesis